MTDQDPTRIAGPDPDATTTATPVTPVTPPAATPLAPPASVPTASTSPSTAEPFTPATYEPAVGFAAAEPVLRPSAPRQRGRFRWAAAIAIVALVIGASVAIAALITGRSPNATVLGYVPAETIAYGEVRLDLPGDQRRAVGEFLSNFPGFADQAALDTKLDEALDDLIKDATENEQTYTTDIKPWFEGELAFSVGPLPPAASIANDPTAMTKIRLLALLSIKDEALARAWFDEAITEGGAKTTTESYGGVTITLFDQGADQPQGAFAIIDGKVAVAGDVSSVRDAIDTKGQGAFSKEEDPAAALDSAEGDHVGFVYVALRPMIDWAAQLSTSMAAEGAPAPAGLEAMTASLPDWGAYWLRIESDAVVMEAVSPEPAKASGPTEDRASTVAQHVPATALVVAISNDYGTTLKDLLAQYKAEPSLKPMLDQLDTGLGLLGGEAAILGWLGDTAVVVNDSAGTPEGGIVALATDTTAAERLLTSLKSLISLGGAQQGITVREEPYAGTTITIVSLGDLGSLSGMGSAGAAAPFPMPTGNVEIAYAMTDDVVVVGSGPGFVKHVLDTTEATSIASNDRYKALVDRAGTGTGSTFVDIAAIRGLVEKVMATDAAANVAKYESDIKPYLLPFDAMVASGSVGGDLNRSTVIITVK